MRTLTHQNVTWHDLTPPKERDLTGLQGKYGFHKLDIEDCLSEHERPKIEEYDDYLFLVFHIPYLSQNGRIQKEELNIFLGQDFVVTLHNGRLPTIENLSHKLEESEENRAQILGQGAGHFLYELMNVLFDLGFPLVDTFAKKLRSIEDELFENDDEIDILRDIMTLKRNIITMRSILLPQRALVASLEHKNRKFVSEDLALYFDDILDAIERQWALLDTAKEVIDALQDTHESWLSHKTNAVVKVLTIFSVTMLPLSVLTGLYGMNVGLPLQDHPHAFSGVITVMVLLLTAMIGYFVKKRWL